MSLLPIVLGVVVATVTEISFDLSGLVYALISIFIVSLMNIFSKKVLKEIPGLHHLTLLFTLSKFSLIMFLPVWFYFDFITIFGQFNTIPSHVYLYLFLDGFCCFMQNIIAFTILSLVTPLTYSVCNCTKRISVIISSLITLRNPITITNVLGMSIATLGVFFYNKVKYEETQRMKLPVKISSDNNTIRYENALFRNPMLRSNGFTSTYQAPNENATKTNGYSNGYVARGHNEQTYVNIY
jgi:solute carrier family 35 protein E1